MPKYRLEMTLDLEHSSDIPDIRLRGNMEDMDKIFSLLPEEGPDGSVTGEISFIRIDE